MPERKTVKNVIEVLKNYKPVSLSSPSVVDVEDPQLLLASQNDHVIDENCPSKYIYSVYKSYYDSISSVSINSEELKESILFYIIFVFFIF
jgi:hypothetical protein